MADARIGGIGDGLDRRARLDHRLGKPAAARAGAEEIRRLVLEGEPERWSPQTEILLFTAARRDHLEKTILPALARGEVVITDRFADSTRMYQGITRDGGADLRAMVDDLHSRMIGKEPDLTILIDIDAETGHSRAVARAGAEQRFEDMGSDMQARMRQGFLTLAARHSRFAVIDGARTPAEVATDVLARAMAHLA